MSSFEPVLVLASALVLAVAQSSVLGGLPYHRRLLASDPQCVSPSLRSSVFDAIAW